MDNPSFRSCSSSLALDTDEAMSASSRIAQDADDVMSESSWTTLAKGRVRDWWSIDLECEMEKLDEGGSVDPKRRLGHRAARTTITKEEAERGWNGSG